MVIHQTRVIPSGANRYRYRYRYRYRSVDPVSVRATITGDDYGRRLRTTITDDDYRRRLRATITGDDYGRRLGAPSGIVNQSTVLPEE